MDVWPPPPAVEKPEPDPEFIQADKRNTIGYTALVFSIVAVVLRAVVFLGFHNSLLGGLSLLLVTAALALGIIARATLAGRLALLGPALFLGLVLYYLLSWYGLLPRSQTIEI